MQNLPWHLKPHKLSPGNCHEVPDDQAIFEVWQRLQTSLAALTGGAAASTAASSACCSCDSSLERRGYMRSLNVGALWQVRICERGGHMHKGAQVGHLPCQLSCLACGLEQTGMQILSGGSPSNDMTDCDILEACLHSGTSAQQQEQA